MKPSAMAFAIVTVVCSTSVRSDEKTTFRFVENQEGITVLDGIHPILTYQRAVRTQDGKWPRSNYVHPLYDLDGEVITEDFPEDHGHHRGIFWAWHQISIDKQPMGDAWVCRDFEWDVIHTERNVENGIAKIRATTLWKSPHHNSRDGQLVPFAREQTVIKIHPRRKDLRFVDFDLCFNALISGVRLGGSDDKKGYGGFSPRIKLTGDEVFLSTQGKIEPKTMQLECGPWIDISTAHQGLAILTHASNPGFPQPWILRRSRSMQNAVYPGREPVKLATDSCLHMRYRLVVHRGGLERSAIDRLQEHFQSSD